MSASKPLSACFYLNIVHVKSQYIECSSIFPFFFLFLFFYVCVFLINELKYTDSILAHAGSGLWSGFEAIKRINPHYLRYAYHFSPHKMLFIFFFFPICMELNESVESGCLHCNLVMHSKIHKQILIIIPKPISVSNFFLIFLFSQNLKI